MPPQLDPCASTYDCETHPAEYYNHPDPEGFSFDPTATIVIVALLLAFWLVAFITRKKV